MECYDDDDNDDDILETQQASSFPVQPTLEDASSSVSFGLQRGNKSQDKRHNMPQNQQPQQQHYESSVLIPCIHHLQHSANSVSDVHLMVSSLSISLASIVNMWKFQMFEPMEQHRRSSDTPEEQQLNYNDEQCPKIPFPREWFDNHGPIHPNYNCVVNFEIMECEDIGKRNLEQVRNLSKAAFGQKTKRIRVYFYNAYAKVVANIIQKAEQYMRAEKTTKRTTNTKDGTSSSVKDRIMISLKNVPARCIFPYFHQDYQSHVHGKPLESEYGLLSDYCICIGGDGCISNNEIGSASSDMECPLCFDSNELEISFVISKKDGNEFEEYIINRKILDKWKEKVTIKDFKRIEGDSHTVDLCKRLLWCGKDKQKNTLEASNVENDNRPHVPNTGTIHHTGCKRKSTIIHQRYTPLDELNEFYIKHENGKRRDREIDICAAVLNVGVPRLTKRNWMMNLTIFDASLEYPKSGLGIGNEINIPQVRLAIFSNRLEDFPQIDCAGDVIVAQRLLVDKFEGEIQLTAFAWSKFTVCRPTIEALDLYHAYDGDNESIHPTNSEDDWHITYQHNASAIHLEWVNDLWKFSQRRMSNYPNVQPKYQITLAQVEEMCSDYKEGDANNCGDLTAMICNIIPYPREEQNLSSPKGILRIWDGTGPACCDPLPERFAVTPEWSTRTEPTEQDMMFLSKIVERTKKEKFEATPQEFSDDRKIFDDFEAPKCLCGRVANVIIWEAQHWALIQRVRSSSSLDMGTFVRFRNAVIKAETVPTLHVNVNTTITPIPVSTFEIKALLLRHFKRTLLNHPFNPRCALLPLPLSERIRGTIPSIESKRFPKDGCSRLIDCILAPPLTPIKVTFHILGAKQDLKTKCLQDICITNGKLVKYQFVFHVCDSHLDMFLIVPEVVAQKMLGVSASDLIEKDKSDIFSKMAYSKLCRLVNSRQIIEGTVMSIIINRSKFFMLTECPVLE